MSQKATYTYSLNISQYNVHGTYQFWKFIITGGWNNNPRAYDFRKIMRKLVVHCAELPSADGNCLIYDDTEEDWLEQPSSFSDLLTLPPPPTQENIEQSTNRLQAILELKEWEKCCIGYIAG